MPGPTKTTQPPKRRGRPPGSRSKPPAAIVPRDWRSDAKAMDAYANELEARARAARVAAEKLRSKRSR